MLDQNQQYDIYTYHVFSADCIWQGTAYVATMWSDSNNRNHPVSADKVRFKNMNRKLAQNGFPQVKVKSAIQANINVS